MKAGILGCLLAGLLALVPGGRAMAAGDSGPGTADLSISVTATVLEHQGRVWYRTEEGDSGEAYDGLILGQGDSIRTGQGAWARLLVSNRGTVGIEENTQLVLSRMSLDAQGHKSVRMRLIKGLFNAVVDKLTLGDSFNVETQNTVVAVKSTQYQVEAGAETRVEVGEGEVWMKGPRGAHVAVMPDMTDSAGPRGFGRLRRLARGEIRTLRARLLQIRKVHEERVMILRRLRQMRRKSMQELRRRMLRRWMKRRAARGRLRESRRGTLRQRLAERRREALRRRQGGEGRKRPEERRRLEKERRGEQP